MRPSCKKAHAKTPQVAPNFPVSLPVHEQPAKFAPGRPDSAQSDSAFDGCRTCCFTVGFGRTFTRPVCLLPVFSATSPRQCHLRRENFSAGSVHNSGTIGSSDSAAHREGIGDSPRRAALSLDIHSQSALACPPMSWASPMSAPDSSAILGLRADVGKQSNRAKFDSMRNASRKTWTRLHCNPSPDQGWRFLHF